MEIVDLESSHRSEIVDIFACAFEQDPLYRYYTRLRGDRHRSRVRSVVKSLSIVHSAAQQPVVGIVSSGEIVAVAAYDLPGIPLPLTPALLATVRLCVVGNPAVASRVIRYLSTDLPHPAEPHVYLSGVAVKASERGRGLGRRLVEHVQLRSRECETSTGVALDTQNPDNVRFYEALGYSLRPQVDSAPIETWSFFRSDALEAR